MSVEKSLIQLILDLLNDPALLAEFRDDPQGVLASCGLSDVTAEDVHDAIVLARDDDDVSFDRDHHTGSQAGAAHVPPPVTHPAPGEDHHEAAIRYIDNYVTNNHYNYEIDDRDTVVDNSVNQNIDTGGGDFRQEIDIDSVVASGDGAVAAGGDIEDSTVTTGDGNIVGDGNQVVSGDDNTTAFGSGDATSTGDVSVDDGSAAAVGGNAAGSHDATDSFNDTETTTSTTTEVSDSHNQDFSQDNDVSVTDNSETHTDLLSHNDVEVAL